MTDSLQEEGLPSDEFDDDSESNTISRIAIDYRRVTKIKHDSDYITWEYTERLTIDRATETIEYVRNFGTQCRVFHRYEIAQGVAEFMDDLDADTLFANFEEEPDDVIETPLDSPMESKEYTITIDDTSRPQRVITGSYDRYGLPDDYDEFASMLFSFLAFYDCGELFDPRIYAKPKRRKSDCLYCSVQFEEYGASYYYRTDDDTISVGDHVLVPAGRNNREAEAEVTSVEYFAVENVPFPIEKTKYILRKV